MKESYELNIQYPSCLSQSISVRIHSLAFWCFFLTLYILQFHFQSANHWTIIVATVCSRIRFLTACTVLLNLKLYWLSSYRVLYISLAFLPYVPKSRKLWNSLKGSDFHIPGRSLRMRRPQIGASFWAARMHHVCILVESTLPFVSIEWKCWLSCWT